MTARPLLPALLTLSLLSCHNLEIRIAEQAEGDILATITEGPKVRWNLGDQLCVNGRAYYATGIEGDAARFASPEGNIQDGEGRLEAFYPLFLMDSGASSLPSLPSDQEYRQDGPDRVPLYAVSETKQLDFKMLTGMLELSLSASSPVHVARLCIRSEKALSGSFRVNEDGEMEMAGSVGSLYMQPDITLGSEAEAFCFCVPAGTYNDAKLLVTAEEGGEKTYSLGDALSIERARTTKFSLTVDADDFIPLNCIYYTSTDGEIIQPYGMSPVSNTYQDGKGVMVFASAISTLASHAFDNSPGYCTDAGRLVSISLPAGVRTFGPYLFQNCTALRQFKIPRNEAFSTISANLFWGCSSLEELYIPDNVTKINNNAFQNCTSLRRVRLPDSITNIPQNTFNGCSSLEEVNIPEALASIGVKAFMGTAITSVTIPEAVASIPSQVFQNCSRLESVTVMRDAADGITTLGAANVFSGCATLAHIYVPASSVSQYKAAPYWSGLAGIISPK